MELKKSPKANLERSRLVFWSMGLLMAVSIVWISYEWKTYGKELSSLASMETEEEEEELPPITRQDTPPPPPPPPPPPVAPQVLEIVEDDVEVEDDIEIEEFDEDTEVAEVVEEEEAVVEDVPFYTLEQMPTFKGCEGGTAQEQADCTQKKLMGYIQDNFRYPPMAKDAGIEGKVYIRFVIGKDGKVGDVTILKKAHPQLNAASIKLIKSIPNYNPGTQRGKPASVYFTLPVDWSLGG